MIRKFAPSAFLLAVILFASGFSLKEWRSSLYDTVRTQAVGSFSSLFNRSVSIESASGPLVGRIELNQVTIAGLGRADKIVLNYNPVRLALAKGDMVAALTRITVVGGFFRIERDREGNFPALAAFAGGGEAGGPPPFRGQVIFRNCRADYSDQRGFRSQPAVFSAHAEALRGRLDLRGRDELKFSFSGRLPESVKGRGLFNLKNYKYELNVEAEKLDLKKWGDYTVPLPGLTFHHGAADVTLRVSPPKTKGWAAALIAQVHFHDAAADFDKYQASSVNGDLFIDDKNLALKNLAARVTDRPLTFDLDGRASAVIKLNDNLADSLLSGEVTVARGSVYGQAVKGSFRFAFRDGVLAANSANLKLYNGLLAGYLKLQLKDQPQLSLTAKFSGLDLATLAQQAPGIEGEADGSLELAGPVKELKGRLSAKLARGLVFGQPMEKVSSAFKLANNNFTLEDLSATAGQVAFHASGAVSSDLVFDLQAEAAGLHLKGRGLFGEMEATLDKFKGRTRWQLNQEFLAQPLRRLTASGTVALSSGRIGDQLFSEARGEIAIGEGKVDLTDAFIKAGQSVVRLGGVTGLGLPTKLSIYSRKLELADLKLFNPFLPPEVREASGTASFEVEVSGELSKETQLVSFDPLLDLTVRGRAALQNGTIAGTPLTSALLKFDWQDRSLELTDCRIVTPASRLALALSYRQDGSLSGSLEGEAHLNQYQNLTAHYAKIGGWAALRLNFNGSLAAPQAAVAFRLDNFVFDDLYFDNITGSLTYSADRLATTRPITITNGTDVYSLAGSLALDRQTPEAGVLDLNCRVLRAELASAYRMAAKIQGEIARRRPTVERNKPLTSLDLSVFKLPRKERFSRNGKLRLYAGEGNKPYFLAAWRQAWQLSEKAAAAAPEENLGGRLTAEATLTGPLNALTGRFSGRLDHGYFREFSFDSFDAAATLKEQSFKIEKALLAKGNGTLAARGSCGFDGVLSLGLAGRSLPLDILAIAFPHKQFKGKIDLNASLSGPWQNLSLLLDAGGKNLSLGGISYNEVSLSAAKKGPLVSLKKLALKQGGELSSASGEVVLAHPGRLNLEVRFKNDALGLFNLLTDQVAWRGGRADLFVRVSGTLDEPEINGNLTLAGGRLTLTSLDSELRDLTGGASVEGGVMTVPGLTGTWTGKRTNEIRNPVGLAGVLDLRRALKQKGALDLNLSFSPTRLYAAFPNLFIGTLDLKSLALRGPVFFDGSAGPLLSGSVEVSNAVITLPSSGGGGQLYPLRLNLDVNLARNAYAVMGDVATLNLSNILMNLEVGGRLAITGPLAGPDLLGRITIKRGTINIFNREFSLLTPELQKKFNSYGVGSLPQNTVNFNGEGVQPALDLTAVVDVDDQEKDASGVYVKKKVSIMAYLKGVMGAKEEERSLKISLSGYTEDKSKSPPAMVPAAYSEQDLKVMLLPDFIKSLTGINQAQGGEQQVDTNAVVADYLNSRVQSLLFRSLEREAEQRLDLESLTLEYNFGPQIGEALGVRDIKGFEQQKPAWSVGFVKGFFDRLYLDVRYAQGADQTATTTSGQTYFNYQLTYKLTPIWSIIYYSEPVMVSQPSGDQKVTLSAGFSFW
ncbi:MAG: translocation/assembly module TamB domain-containing protein [Candidatus Saganbacteria bacterium]|nr:translocation/assembly module TamB domain-containing protein [Candidatus Saganbacteria bacterium]